MKKLDLGVIPYPERYAPANDDCMLADSLEAYDFFKDFYTPNGLVVLGKATFASLVQDVILVWIYIDIKKQEVLSLLPIFKSDYEQAKAQNILKVDFFDNEIFFFKEDSLYSSVFTSTGQTVLLKVRSLPVLNEFWEVLQLEGKYTVTDLYPAKVYNSADNSFLATCWAFSTDSDELYFKPVCIDDNEKFDNVDIDKTEVFPVDLNETALIGGESYILRYKKEWGQYFDKVFTAEKKPPKAKKKTNKPHKAVIFKMPDCAAK